MVFQEGPELRIRHQAELEFGLQTWAPTRASPARRAPGTSASSEADRSARLDPLLLDTAGVVGTVEIREAEFLLRLMTGKNPQTECRGKQHTQSCAKHRGPSVLLTR